MRQKFNAWMLDAENYLNRIYFYGGWIGLLTYQWQLGITIARGSIAINLLFFYFGVSWIPPIVYGNIADECFGQTNLFEGLENDEKEKT
jgi:hypothetical protein